MRVPQRSSADSIVWCGRGWSNRYLMKPSKLAKPITCAAAAAALAVLTACSTDKAAETASNEKVVNVYNWADYIAPDTLDKFEAEYGIKVNYDVYDSSEVVDVKLLAGNSGYDVVVHSSQFSSRLTPIGIYEKLDYSRLDNIRHLDQELRERTDVYKKTKGYVVPYH